MKRALLVSSLFYLACNGKVSRDECHAMLDKYLEMEIAGDHDLQGLPPAEAAAAREMKKALRKSDAAYRRAESQCQAEVSRSEYRCAMKAPTPETWQACID